MSNETDMIPPDEAELQRRITELARSKSRLELLNRLLVSLSSVAGLDNTVQHILEILMQTVGAANISIVFRVNGILQLRDIYGTNREFVAGEDPEVERIVAGGQAVRLPQTASDSAPAADGIRREQWIFPLLSRDRRIGAVRLEGMEFTDQQIFDELQPFFVYAGVILDNEISNFSRLTEAHLRLQESETLYRNLFEQSPDGIIIWSFPAPLPLQFNEAAHLQLGYTREEFAALTVKDLRPGNQEAEMERHTETLRREGTVGFEALHRTKSGECRWFFILLKLFRVDDRQLVLAIHRDIHDLKESTRNLELYRHALDNARDMIFLTRSDATFQFVNRAACEATGLNQQELLKRSVFDLNPYFGAEGWEPHWEEVTRQGTMGMEGHMLNRDGVLIPVELALKPFTFDGTEYVVAAARDLTERRQLEEERHRLEQQLLHAQKLESLGALAGGVAHEFNNILMAIVGNADLAMMRIGKESPAAGNLKQIEKAAMRAADLSKQMLAYSGKGNFQIESVDLNALLQEMLHMLELSISRKVLLRLHPTRVLPTVEVDAGQIRQIVMNLVINASEAIGDSNGLIVIKTGCMECDQIYLDDVWLGDRLQEGSYAYIEIADNGCGMSKEILERIFDPFFTTKFTGRGLGMAAVLGIVRGHHGTVKVYSEPGRGTTVRILLPAANLPAEMADPGDGEEAWSKGTVLLVDDEETVRDVAVAMLGELGFSTVTAKDGREALEIFSRDRGINFVILDLSMPHMDGDECFRQLRRIDPEVQVIISSGYNEREVAQLFAGKGVTGFIQKPYTLSVLSEAVKDFLRQ